MNVQGKLARAGERHQPVGFGVEVAVRLAELSRALAACENLQPAERGSVEFQWV